MGQSIDFLNGAQQAMQVLGNEVAYDYEGKRTLYHADCLTFDLEIGKLNKI